MKQNRRRKKLQRFSSRMPRFNTRENWYIDLPDGRREITCVPLGLVALRPPEEARLVLPHIKRVRQDGLVLEPDDLLMDKDPTIAQRLFDFNLTLAFVPDIHRG